MGTDRNPSQILISYEGTIIGNIQITDMKFAQVPEDGCRYWLELSPGGQVRLSASQELMKSFQDGELAYFLDEKRWKGKPPLRAYLLTRI